MMKIYFAGSIRGGREDAALYQEMIQYLGNFGKVLTEHIGNNELTPNGEARLSDQEIFRRDMEWLSSADLIVAEVTNPSLGVGFEVANAVILSKRVLCLYRPRPGKRLSAMIGGCKDVEIVEYQTMDELRERLPLRLK